jgi:hypothetical protein
LRYLLLVLGAISILSTSARAVDSNELASRIDDNLARAHRFEWEMSLTTFYPNPGGPYYSPNVNSIAPRALERFPEGLTKHGTVEVAIADEKTAFRISFDEVMKGSLDLYVAHIAHTCDGETSYNAISASRADILSSGSIGTVDGATSQPEIENYWYGAPQSLRNGLREGAARIGAVSSGPDGLITVEFQRRSRRHVFLIDSRQGYNAVVREEYSDGVLRLHEETAFKRYSTGFWYPDSGKRVFFFEMEGVPDSKRINNTVTMRTTRIVVGEAIDEDKFRINFPPGTTVADTRTGKFVQSHGDLYGIPRDDATTIRRWSMKLRWVLVGAIVALTAALLVARRRWVRGARVIK